MLKAALLCSAICTAFVVGGPSSVTTQDKPAQAAKAVSLREVLKPLIGKKCRMDTDGGTWSLVFGTADQVEQECTLKSLETDHLRLVHKNGIYYVPFSALRHVFVYSR